jgi:hypothetical protein
MIEARFGFINMLPAQGNKLDIQDDHNLITTFQVHTKQNIQDTENWFALLERKTHQIQYFSV